MGEDFQVSSLPTDREAVLEARIAELEEELRSRDEFFAIAAHELRNPMTPIGAGVELLLAKARRTPDAVPSGIVQGLERLDRLVDGYLRRATILLEASRVSSASLRLRATEVDLSALVRRVATIMLPAAAAAGFASACRRISQRDAMPRQLIRLSRISCRTPSATVRANP